MQRVIPGMIDVDGREFLYVEIRDAEDFDSIIDASLGANPDVPMPRAGGVIEEKTRLTLADGTSLLAMSYKGDLNGWRAKLTAFCAMQSRRWGTASHQVLHMSDGTTFSLRDCTASFEN